MHKNVTQGRLFIGRFDHGDDLLAALTAFCRDNKITCGTFSLIGAVQKASVGYYDQGPNKYDPPLEFNQHLEIISCTGNVSLKDGQPFVHAHIVLADREGKAFGGHLMPGTIVFAAEFSLRELDGATLERLPDETTGLQLWK